MNNTVETSSLILSLHRKEAALWLGPMWSPPDSSEDQLLLSKQDWIGVWSDSQSPETAKMMNHGRKDASLYRRFEEIPDAVDDYLQPDFRWSDYCPFFYLNGRSGNSVKLTPAKRVLARLTKLQHLERLSHTTLIACGFASPGQFVSALEDSVCDFLGGIERVFIVGIENPDRWQSPLQDNVDSGLLEKIALVSDSLPTILKESEGARPREEKDLTRQIIAKGKVVVPLDDLLRTDPPLDQYFLILTASDIRSPSKLENKVELLEKLLANVQPCWRAFAHELEWRRPIYLKAKKEIDNVLRELEKPIHELADVNCFDVTAETGSGLSILLQWLAFRMAEQHYPTILARETCQSINYGTLRRYLVDLDRQLAERGAPRVPIVVVLGDEVFTDDTSGQMGNLPRLLRMEARRVLLIRGMYFGNESNVARHRDTGINIRTVLDHQEELPSLIEWARNVIPVTTPTDQSTDAALTAIETWQSSSTNVPLLVGLDYVLTDKLRSAADFSKHLLRRFADEASALFRADEEADKDGGHIVHTKDGPARLTLGELSWKRQRPTRQNLAEALIIVSALARLKTAIPLSILETMMNVDTPVMYQIVSLLERSKLMKTDVLSANSRIKPRPYYDGFESVRLSHYLYANMLLRSLASDNVGTNLEIGSSDLCKSFLHIVGETSDEDPLPVPLLGPVCSRLKPGNQEHLKYAEFLSMQYMRISYDDESSDRFSIMRQKLDDLMLLYEDLPKAMIDDSVTLLHSRALNCRWTIPLKPPHLDSWNIDSCRNVASDAEDYLRRAFVLAEERVETESPDNLKTSLGLVHRNRAIVEMNHQEGSRNEWAKHLQNAKQCFREVLNQGPNTYAAHALADLQIRELEINAAKKGSLGYEDVPRERLAWFPHLRPTDLADKLSEAFLLLSAEPEQKFEMVWNRTKRRAFELLNAQGAAEAIRSLKQARDEMGYVLEAMRHLEDFRIPEEPTSDNASLHRIEQASLALNAAKEARITACPLGNLLRYALFSARKERIPEMPGYDSAYRQRYELIKQLKRNDGSLYYDEPIWLYDYAMLAFQNGDTKEGQRMFRRLRAGALYRRVPWERSRLWVEPLESRKPVEGSLRISRLEQRYNQGWGYLTTERQRLDEPIPFKISVFLEFNPQDQVQVGKAVRCRIRLQPAGTYAIPLRA